VNPKVLKELQGKVDHFKLMSDMHKREVLQEQQKKMPKCPKCPSSSSSSSSPSSSSSSSSSPFSSPGIGGFDFNFGTSKGRNEEEKKKKEKAQKKREEREEHEREREEVITKLSEKNLKLAREMEKHKTSYQKCQFRLQDLLDHRTGKHDQVHNEDKLTAVPQENLTEETLKQSVHEAEAMLAVLRESQGKVIDKFEL
jgi:hypothetical protein